MNRRILTICLTAILAVTMRLQAQFQTDYGQNRIQYKSFDWVYYSTNHFDIYHYRGGEEYADQAIDFLEEEFNKITDLLGYAPYSKTKIFIYNSIHDLQQSNIGIEGAQFSIGGQTDFVKLQIEIAHPGLTVQFRQELIYKLTRVLIEEMLFGGSLAEIFQSSYLLNLPVWFIDGAARYLAYGWSVEMDDYVRTYLSEKDVRKLVKIQGDEAGLIGQSVWNYIAINYGRSNVSNILNLTRIIRNEENSIASTLGVTYKQFIKNWQNYYLDIQKEIAADYVSPLEENAVVAKRNDAIIYKNVRINNKSNLIAYSHNQLGRYQIFVSNLQTGQTEKIQKGGIRVKGQKVDYDLPLLDWVDEQTLGMVYFKRGFLYLATYNLATKERIEKPLTRFNKVEGFSFNENGRLAVISGEIDGNSDIYLVSMRRNAIRRVTNDIFDDEDPVFVPGTASIVFSSNRPSDSLDISDSHIEELSDNFNLFLYDLDTTETNYFRITNTFSRDYRPQAKSPYEIYFLSDQRGITNLFRYSFIDSTYQQITNYDRSIKDYDIHFGEEDMLFLMLDGGVDKVYFDKEIDLKQSRFSPQTARQRFIQAQYVANLYNERELRKAKEKKEATEEVKKAIETDSLKSRNDTLKANDPGIDPDKFVFVKPESNDVEGVIDTDNYKFSETTDASKFRPESFFTNYQRLELSNNVMGPITYDPQFSFSNLTTSFAIDPVRGFGAVVETQINDILGNYKLSGGGFIIPDLRSGDLYAEFNYLKGRVDLRVRVDRQTFFLENNDEDVLRQQYLLNKVTVGASLPLSNWLRFEFNPFFARTNFNNLQYTVVINRGAEDFAEDRQVSYVGFNARSVFDNTIDKGFNIVQGTRGAVEFNLYQSVTNANLSFSNLRVDLRHYQKIHRELTFATRLFYGEFFGPNKQDFLLGGVPNWVLNETRSHNSGDPLQVSNQNNDAGLFFSEFVNNLRGFPFNEKFGNSTLLFNAELRFPIFQYFSRAPISSTFLRNFSVMSFFDFGSAWNGTIPLSLESNSNVIRYPASDNSIFSAEVTNFKNPWLASYGFGLRTVLLGYYVKIDYALPIEEFEVQDRRFILSIGLDF